MIRRGTWQPDQTDGALLVAQVAVLAGSVVRGADYLRQDDDAASVLSRVQDSAPLIVWGVVLVVAGAGGLIGLAGHWGRVIAVGHLLATAAYASISYGLLWVTGFGPGIRTPFGLMVVAVIHGSLGGGILTILRRRKLQAELPVSELL